MQKDTSILVTGGTGSFGKAFIRRVLMRTSLRRIVVFSRDEQKQWEMESAIREAGLDPNNRLRFFIGDIRDRDRLELALHGIDTVVHAAALKIVPTAEYNPFECILTNVYGAENVVKASLRAGVRRVVALWTDKAASPINLYGASKLAADKIMVAANNFAGGTGCRFAVVRYGNVAGSRGSVIPFFQRLIAEGAESLPITDPRMTRFWIRLEQGVDFVMSSLEAMKGGEIFVPKIPSMKMIDLARALAPDLPHRVVGIRPGEKLHEVMITEDDARAAVEWDDRYVILPFGDTRLAAPDARLLPEGFRYASNTNPEWLDAAGLQDMLASSIDV